MQYLSPWHTLDEIKPSSLVLVDCLSRQHLLSSAENGVWFLVHSLMPEASP